MNPYLIKHKEERARDVQNRIADTITRFAGSMTFVYVHIIWFAVWIGLRVEHYPFGLLTMIVSLEAIFLSTFVLISQNRADAKRQVVADHQWQTVQEEDQQNRELLDRNQILNLTKAVHAYARAAAELRPAGESPNVTTTANSGRPKCARTALLSTRLPRDQRRGSGRNTGSGPPSEVKPNSCVSAAVGGRIRTARGSAR